MNAYHTDQTRNNVDKIPYYSFVQMWSLTVSTTKKNTSS